MEGRGAEKIAVDGRLLSSIAVNVSAVSSILPTMGIVHVTIYQIHRERKSDEIVDIDT